MATERTRLALRNSQWPYRPPIHAVGTLPERPSSEEVSSPDSPLTRRIDEALWGFYPFGAPAEVHSQVGDYEE